MGELLLCREPIASMPFYMEGISLNLYSLEELSYYIWSNTYLLEPDFMSEELCTWIDKEIGREALAAKLREIIHKNGKLVDFLTLILEDCGYCTRQEILTIRAAITELSERSEFECNKIRADRLMEKDKILSSIYEYKRLLESEDAKEQPVNLIGNIWHNLGTAYASLYLFDAAIDCFPQAYETNHDEESLKSELLAYRCKRDESGYIRAGITYGLDEMRLQELRNELSMASRGEGVVEFEQHLESVEQLRQMDQKVRYRDEIQEIIMSWKEDYRRLSRI